MRFPIGQSMSWLVVGVALGLGDAHGADTAVAKDGYLTPRQYPAGHNGVEGKHNALGWDGPDRSWMTGLEDLNLTAEQRQSIKIIAESYRTRGWDLAQRGSGIREQLTSVSPDDPSYAGATSEAAQTAAVLAADMVRIFADLRAEVHTVLTDDQRQLLKERLSGTQKRWDEWRFRHKTAE